MDPDKTGGWVGLDLGIRWPAYFFLFSSVCIIISLSKNHFWGTKSPIVPYGYSPGTNIRQVEGVGKILCPALD